MQKIGLFGGTFDPVHIGHLVVGKAVVNQLDLDQLIYIPAPLPPHKQEIDITPFHHHTPDHLAEERCYEINVILSPVLIFPLFSTLANAPRCGKIKHSEINNTKGLLHQINSITPTSLSMQRSSA